MLLLYFARLLKYAIISLIKVNLPLSSTFQETQPKTIDIRSSPIKLMIGDVWWLDYLLPDWQ